MTTSLEVLVEVKVGGFTAPDEKVKVALSTAISQQEAKVEKVND